MRRFLQASVQGKWGGTHAWLMPLDKILPGPPLPDGPTPSARKPQKRMQESANPRAIKPGNCETKALAVRSLAFPNWVWKLQRPVLAIRENYSDQSLSFRAIPRAHPQRIAKF